METCRNIFFKYQQKTACNSALLMQIVRTMLRRSMILLAFLFLFPNTVRANTIATAFNHIGNDVKYSFAGLPVFLFIGGSFLALDLGAHDSTFQEPFRNKRHLGKA